MFPGTHDRPRSGPWLSLLRASLAAWVALLAFTSLTGAARAQTTEGIDELEVDANLSRNGRFVCYSRAGDYPYHVRLIDRHTGQEWDVGRGNTASVSDDGRSVAFIAAGEGIVVTDPVTGKVTDLDGGLDLDFAGWVLAMTPSGRHVIFDAEVTSPSSQVYLHDRDPDGNGILDEGNGVIELISVALNGQPCAGRCPVAAISDDGQRVAFASNAPDLVANDTNGVFDVFVRDRAASSTRRASVTDTGDQASGESGAVTFWYIDGITFGWSRALAISAGGSQVAFGSTATNLVFSDANGKADVFVHDLVTGTNELVSRDSQGQPGDDHSGVGGEWFDGGFGTILFLGRDGVDLSADGRYVAFASSADNLTTDDPISGAGVYLRDRLTGQTSCESLSTQGDVARQYSYLPRLSADGTSLVFMSSSGGDLVGDWDVMAFHRSRLSGRMVGPPSPGQTVHFELRNGNADRVGELAVMFLSCTGLGPTLLPGGLVLHLTFDACTIAGLGQLAVLSGDIDPSGSAVMPSFTFPALPSGLRIYFAAITWNGLRISATTDPFIVDIP